jgi:hypothetical protein
MCCGKADPPAPVAESGNRMAKMPDGSYVEVTSKADERAKKQESYRAMREQARTAWTAVES